MFNPIKSAIKLYEGIVKYPLRSLGLACLLARAGLMSSYYLSSNNYRKYEQINSQITNLESAKSNLEANLSANSDSDKQIVDLVQKSITEREKILEGLKEDYHAEHRNLAIQIISGGVLVVGGAFMFLNDIDIEKKSLKLAR